MINVKIESELQDKQCGYAALIKEANQLEAENKALQVKLHLSEAGILDQANSSREQKEQLEKALRALEKEKIALKDQLQANSKQLLRLQKQVAYYQKENGELIQGQNGFEQRAFEAEALAREAQKQISQAYQQVRTVFGESEKVARQALINEQQTVFETIDQAKTVDNLTHEILLRKQAVERMQKMYGKSEADKAELRAKHSSEIKSLQQRVDALIAEQDALDEEKIGRLNSERDYKQAQTYDNQTDVREYQAKNGALEAELKSAHTCIASMEQAMMRMFDHDADADLSRTSSVFSDPVSLPTDFSSTTKSSGSRGGKKTKPRVNLAVRVRRELAKAAERAAQRKQEQAVRVLTFKRKA